MKEKLFSVKSLVTGLKGLAASIVAGLILLLPTILGTWLISKQTLILVIFGLVIYLTTMIFEIFLWGFFARKWYRWN